MAYLEKVYEVDVEGKRCGFFLEQQDHGVVWLRIPDAGGQADASPKYPPQLTWVHQHLERLSGMKAIWSTIWEIRDQLTLLKVEQILQQEGCLSQRTPSCFY